MSLRTTSLAPLWSTPATPDASPLVAPPDGLFFVQLLTQLLDTSVQDANPSSPFMAQSMRTLEQHLTTDADRTATLPQAVLRMRDSASDGQADGLLENLLDMLQMILQPLPTQPLPTPLATNARGWQGSSEGLPVGSWGSAVSVDASSSGAVDGLIQPPHAHNVMLSDIAPTGGTPSALATGEEAAARSFMATETGNTPPSAAPVALNLQAPAQGGQTLEEGTLPPESEARATTPSDNAAPANPLATLAADSGLLEPGRPDAALAADNTAETSHGRDASIGRRFSVAPAETAARLLGHPLPRHTVLLQLEPPELGVLQVHVHVTDERVTASFWSESPAVRSLLHAHFPTLSETLSAQGFDPQQVSISLAADGFQGDASTFFQRQSGFLPYSPSSDQSASAVTQPQGTEVPTRPLTRRHDGLLDLVI